MRFLYQCTFFLCFLCLSVTVQAQKKATIQGKVTDKDGAAAISNVSIVAKGQTVVAQSDDKGSFTIEVPPGKVTLILTHDGYQSAETQVVCKAKTITPVMITMSREASAGSQTDFPMVTLDNDDGDNEGGDNDVSGVLRAGRDIFQNATSFNLSSFRFSERGYNGEWAPTFINGAPLLNSETGWVSFSEVGGLNDVLRNKTSSVGMDLNENSFGDIGGGSNIDSRAVRQRKGVRISYASANRNYRNRLMGTYHSGLVPGGWALSLSASRRWAQEGYQPGTFYESTSYFVGIDKVTRNKVHGFSFNLIGSKTKQGRASDSFQEMYDAAGSNYYNPMWGYQNGKKRNSSVRTFHQPMAIFRYDWNPTRSTRLTASMWLQTGPWGNTRLDWATAGNPLPDYNRNLPSAQPDSVSSAAWATLLASDEKYRQINWQGLYDANRNNTETVNNADGTGQSVTGKRSVYILEDQRQDNTESGVNITMQKTLNARLTMQGGFLYHTYLGHNFRVVDDLLGGDYFLDYDRYAIGAFPELVAAENNDLQVPNNVVRKGERYGYDYDEHVNRTQPWLQASYVGGKFEVFGGAQYTRTDLWRTGKMQNGKFPNNSLGDSEKLHFNTPAFKLGTIYKLNGRNFIYANAGVGQRAPKAGQVYLSPRNSNNIVQNLGPAEYRSIEGGYQLRAPYLRGRITGYLTDVANETENRTYFQPSISLFANAVIRGIDRRHTGVEMAFEYKPTAAMTLTTAANIGKFYYTSRPTVTLTSDNKAEAVIVDEVIYQKNYYIPRTPQNVGTVGIKYDFPNFMFATLNANYSSGTWYSFDVVRRTADFVATLEPNSAAWDAAIDQQKADGAFTLDLFVYKSWSIKPPVLKKQRKFVALTLGINNLLNNQNIIISGRDAYRNAFRDADDTRRYSNELSYAFGINYFAGLTFRFN
jgi:TonB dependent receptor/CarboxypepD_reg-like domain